MHDCDSVGPDVILRFFREYGEHQRDSQFQDVALPLMRDILDRYEFESLGSLIEFCSDPENLLPWLRVAWDRIRFSEELVKALLGLTSEQLQAS